MKPSGLSAQRPTLLRFVVLALSIASASATAAPKFSAAWLTEQARELSKAEYVPPREVLPDWLGRLSYDQHRDIRFKGTEAIWGSNQLPFQLQFFHPGFLFKTLVDIHLVREGRAERLAFKASLFDYGQSVGANERDAQGLGFAGFRVHHPLNRREYYDELITFLGASYFRGLGKGDLYGLSARGLAVDTAQPGGEEFPLFKAFWIEEPAPGAKAVVIHALLDSPRVAGAYTFVVTPGQPTLVEVTATLFPRADIDVVGIAPLTSMYLHGENDRMATDFRPEVHDSDGLLIANHNGEWLWRPLSNPRRLNVSSFQFDAIKGFGLLQRDRAFTSYEDLEARYEKRPSVWIEPTKGFGRGVVRLVEIPSEQEIHDNVVAFWMADEPVRAGARIDLGYRMHWGAPLPTVRPLSEVVATRIAVGSTPAMRKFVIDFGPVPGVTAPEPPPSKRRQARPPAGTLSGGGIPASMPLEVSLWTSHGETRGAVVQRHDVTGGLRVFFELDPQDAPSIELRCLVRSGGRPLTETWSYLWSP